MISPMLQLGILQDKLKLGPVNRASAWYLLKLGLAGIGDAQNIIFQKRYIKKRRAHLL